MQLQYSPSAIGPTRQSGTQLRERFADQAIDTRIIQPGDAASYELLEAGYEGLFSRYFANEVYQEPLTKWHSRLEAADAPSRYIIGISGTNLDHPEDRKLAGMFVGIYYKNAASGLLAYNIVDTPYQGTGLGRHQVEVRKAALVQAAREHGRELTGLFAECNDPARVKAADDVMNPASRIEIYGRMGGRAVPIDYVCPSGSDIGDKLGDMMLLAFPSPTTGRYPDANGVSNFLRGVYEVRGLPVIDDQDYNRMQRELAIAEHRARVSGKPLLKPVVDSKGKYLKGLSVV